MDIAPGQKILNDKYLILEEIGEGGMAGIWLAQQIGRLALKVIVKVPLSTDNGVDSQRFAQELEIAQWLRKYHIPNVAEAVDIGELEDGTPVLVTKYYEGGSLAERLKENLEGLPIEDALAITDQILEALAAFHELPQSPVHRDITPSNILFDVRENAYLSDFGVSQIQGVTRDRSVGLAMGHPGTPMYAAPEATEPFLLTESADLYMLGCVLFEMLTGRTYSPNHSIRPSEVRNEIPVWLDTVLVKALAVDPISRWQSAEEFRKALKDRNEIEDFVQQSSPDEDKTGNPRRNDTMPEGRGIVDAENNGNRVEDSEGINGVIRVGCGVELDEFIISLVLLILAAISFGIALTAHYRPNVFPPEWTDSVTEGINLGGALFAFIFLVLQAVVVRQRRQRYATLRTNRSELSGLPLGIDPSILVSVFALLVFSLVVIVVGLIIYFGFLAFLNDRPVVIPVPATDTPTMVPTQSATIGPTQTPLPPIAVVDFPNSATVGDPVEFDGIQSVTTSEDLIFTWDFGDGTKAEGPTVTHAFWEPGIYTILLNITDSSGLSDRVADTISIKSPATDTPTPHSSKTPTPPPTSTPTVHPTDTSTLIPSTDTPTPHPTVTPTTTTTPPPTHTPTPRPTQTPTPIPPTDTPRPRATATATQRIYPTPTLLSPTDGSSFDPGSTVTLQWSSVGPLAIDDHYLLTVDHSNGASYIVTDAIQWNVPDWLESFQPVIWSTKICRGVAINENGYNTPPPCTYEGPASTVWQFGWGNTTEPAPTATAKPATPDW